jgi:two-component system, NtrC family, sensor kinase
MVINLKTKIWFTIFSIVLMFSFFTLDYFPRQQGNLLINNYNTEIQNLANTVSLGVKIAITEQNFEGVQTAIDFVKADPRLQFVSMITYDTAWNSDRSKYQIKKTIFKTFPENEHPNPGMLSNDSIIVKNSPFVTSTISGDILLGFNTKDIIQSKRKIRIASLMVSSIVFFIGILIGFWLARNISVPVLALRDAAMRVGEGDLNQKVKHIPNDEIGELGRAFNKMIDELSKTRSELKDKNTELSETVNTLNNTMVQLKNTHAQLIQSEKMASLGELTAGIAHEIQNPLNFVNNFSEVNTELIEEMKAELRTGNQQLALSIAEDIKENEKKINHHGRRADAIVKNMLQHSRNSTGQKELADINTLTDEYLRLSYHGLRAKDKSFNISIEKHFDQSIQKINVNPQDIGRVLLNLFNNAFYSVNEKKAMLGTSFEPKIFVGTSKVHNMIQVKIRDNGNGIPKKVLDKIYQPFFTTKPSGEGTGLGLSLSYDIIKAHGGTIKAETIEGEFAEFLLELPMSLTEVL